MEIRNQTSFAGLYSYVSGQLEGTDGHPPHPAQLRQVRQVRGRCTDKGQGQGQGTRDRQGQGTLPRQVSGRVGNPDTSKDRWRMAHLPWTLFGCEKGG